MYMSKAKSKGGPSSVALRVVKSAFAAALLTIALILVYAFTLKMNWLDERSIPIVNSVIKVLGSVFASILAVLKIERRSWLIGGIAGVAYILLAYLVFSVTTQNVSISWALLSDIGIGALAGMLSAMFVQLRR
jgi:putative membrane protein (TIGR04086 family)